MKNKRILGLFLLLSFSLLSFTYSPVPVQATGGYVDDMFKQSGDKVEKKSDVETVKEATPDKINFFDYFKMIFALIFVIGLLYLLLRFINSKNGMTSNQEYLQNLGGIHVGSNKSIQIIRTGNKVMIVGVGDSVQLLKEVSDEEEVTQLLETYNKKMENMFQANSYMERIFQLKGKFTGAKTKDQSLDFKSQFMEQIEQMKVKRSDVVNRYKDESKGNDL